MIEPTIPNRLHALRAAAEEIRHAAGALEDIGACIDEWEYIDALVLCTQATAAIGKVMAAAEELRGLKVEYVGKEGVRA